MNRLRRSVSFAIGLGLVFLSLLSSQAQEDWTQIYCPSSLPTRIACSADGATLVVLGMDPATCNYGLYLSTDYLYASTNYAISWTFLGMAGSDLAGRADGTKWILANARCGDFMFSVIPGGIWPTTSLSSVNVTNSLVASSADGGTLLAAGISKPFGSEPVSQGILRSTNSGVSWQTLLTNIPVIALSCSADAVTIVAAAETNFVYVSTNSGLTWSTNIVDSQWSGGWNSLACSADAARLFAASEDGLFASKDAGISWIRIHEPDSFCSIAVSADGTRLVAGTKSTVVYTSTNAGIDWTQSALREVNTDLTTVAITADGSTMFAGVYYGNIYLRRLNSPPPSLNLVPFETNVSLFWQFPSTNYVLQQAAEATTNVWTDVATRPSLNLSNLHNQVILPATSPGMFYRLSTRNHSWGTFENLDFESATIPNPVFQVVPFGLAFPGWIGYTGTQQVTNAIYDTVFLSSAGFGLQTNLDYLGLTHDPLNGRYAISIQAGSSLLGEGQVSSYLSQTGMIPSEAQSMRFNVSSTNVVVSVAGQTLTVIPLGGVRYGVNVADFSGKTAELRFTVLPSPFPFTGSVYLDSIGFYPRPVP